MHVLSPKRSSAINKENMTLFCAFNQWLLHAPKHPRTVIGKPIFKFTYLFIYIVHIFGVFKLCFLCVFATECYKPNSIIYTHNDNTEILNLESISSNKLAFYSQSENNYYRGNGAYDTGKRLLISIFFWRHY